MRKRKVSILMILGVCLVLCSICLVTVLHIRMYSSTQTCKSVAVQLAQLLPERTPWASEEYPNTVMPVLEMDEVDYVALLEIPSLERSLPVADQWSGSMLHSNVGRFLGSAYDRSLVIGGPDYPGQFDFCDDVDIGTQITVTDMTGTRFSYTVTRVDRSQNAQTQWLAATEYDLTLFCRDLYSMEYIAVRCTLS